MKKVLIANRGEIAVRTIRALKELGLSSVAVYSQEDRDSPHVNMADESWCIGPASAKESYLNIKRVLSAAKIAGAQAIHPGYGFLAENDQFATACDESGLIFIGPKGNVMKRLADKFETKEMVRRAGVPVIPGSQQPTPSLESALSEARAIGFPVLLKANFGGGGRGIYLAHEEPQFARAFDLARAESRSAVGKEELYLEKFLDQARHVEVQVARDNFGHVHAFIERDCTIQRRNQKLIEESPSPFISAEIRPKLLDAAAKAVAACELTALSTVEFLLLPDQKTFYFMEINKRIQVEHPVTEELLGIDLIQLQIAIAFGERMPKISNDFGSRHAIEARINCEDAAQNFMPGEGLIARYEPPGGPGVRMDTYLTPMLQVGTNYDSLLAKLIVSSPSGRLMAINRMKRALGELVIEGVPTTIFFHQKLLNDPIFAGGQEWFTTRYLETWIPKQKFN